MYIFEIDGGVVKPTPFALLTQPFKNVWDTDTHPHKKHAIQIFTYVELFCSKLRSNIFSSLPEDIRGPEILKNMFSGNLEEGNWIRISDLTIECMKAYDKINSEYSPTLSLLNSNAKAMKELENFLNNVDLTERTDKGFPVYKPGDITRAMKDVKEIAENSISLRDKVSSEILDSIRTRKNRDIGLFEE